MFPRDAFISASAPCKVYFDPSKTMFRDMFDDYYWIWAVM